MGAVFFWFEKYGVFLIAFIFLIEIVLLAWFFLLRRKMKLMLRGNRGDLESALLSLQKNQITTEEILNSLDKRAVALEVALPQDIRNVGLVRFNPFSDSGSDQSFALALLNDKKSGVVISSLYGREMSRIYAKPIEAGASRYSLSDEEKTAIEKALHS